jgi:hypothetical protein
VKGVKILHEAIHTLQKQSYIVKGEIILTARDVNIYRSWIIL